MHGCNFPQEMITADRWMVRPTGKQPISAHQTRPATYEPPPGQADPNSRFWRWRWNVPAVWASYATAKSVVDRSDGFEGLSFVLHPAGNLGEQNRLICLDFDSAITDGGIDPYVADILDDLDTFCEYSRSGTGIHAFLCVEDCPAFVNNLKKRVGDSFVDVLCSSQVAVTGQRILDCPIRKIHFDRLKSFSFFEFKKASDAVASVADWADGDPLESVPENLQYLISDMERVEAIEGNRGSQVLFAAACTLAKHAVTGREAEVLLKCVPATPPFSPEEIQRTIDCAVAQVTADGEFGSLGIENEFDILPSAPNRPEPSDYGFTVVPIGELMTSDFKVDYVVDRAFVGEGALIIGGKEKCFKTGLAMDLAISLASGRAFLGEFEILQRLQTAFFTAEISLFEARNLATRVSRSKGLRPKDLNGVDIINAVPSFAVDKTGRPIDMKGYKGLEYYLNERRPNVAIFDPLYWALGGSSVGDMYEIGTVLRTITRLCDAYGVWPIFCHHGRKGSNEDVGRPMELGDLYGSGAQQFARQWMLVSHAEPFRNGVADLWVRMGSSVAGDRGLWRLKIDEGQADEIIDRTWSLDLERDSGESSSVSESDVIAAIQQADNGKGVTVQDIKFITDSREGMIESLLRKLIASDRVEMRAAKRFSLTESE